MTEQIKQPEALRLADVLDHGVYDAQMARNMDLAATELRRLHAEVERLQAELARLTTLRPLSEWKDGDYNVLWWYRRNGGGMYGLQSRFEHCLGWTPLPKVKETK